MDIRGFHHLAIQVHALEKVAAFYREVLGLTEQSRHLRPDGSVRSLWLAVPGGFLALEQVDETTLSTPFRHPRPGLHLVALRIPREARAGIVETLRARGIAIEHQTRWTVYVRDPEGNRVGLSHHPKDPIDAE